MFNFNWDNKGHKQKYLLQTVISITNRLNTESLSLKVSCCLKQRFIAAWLIVGAVGMNNHKVVVVTFFWIHQIAAFLFNQIGMIFKKKTIDINQLETAPPTASASI